MSELEKKHYGIPLNEEEAVALLDDIYSVWPSLAQGHRMLSRFLEAVNTQLTNSLANRHEADKIKPKTSIIYSEGVLSGLCPPDIAKENLDYWYEAGEGGLRCKIHDTADALAKSLRKGQVISTIELCDRLRKVGEEPLAVWALEDYSCIKKSTYSAKGVAYWTWMWEEGDL